MTIDINIPNGKMRINVNGFFAQAELRKIRKMFKYLKESGIDDNTRHELEVLLNDEEKKAEEYKRFYAQKYFDEMNRIQELEEENGRMKNPCYLEFTRDKDKLAEKRKVVMASKRKATGYKREFQVAVQKEKRYQKIKDFWLDIL